MKKILGLDLGTNSIGWAVVEADNDTPKKISAAGSRIIPMGEDVLSNFNSGNTSKNSTVKSQTAQRTGYRGGRRLFERNLLRRERLLKTLKVMNFLPEHFATQIDENGKFVNDDEPKIAWRKNVDGKYEFVFKDSFAEMAKDFEGVKIPYDWTIYYLRKKALTQKITKEELAWILLQFNQKRGYYQLRGEEEEEDNSKKVEYLAAKVVKVEATDEKKGEDTWYNVYLENGMIYRRTSKIPLDWEGKVKEFIVTTDLEKDGTPKKNSEGNIKRSFRAPKDDDWTLLKKKTEHDIDQSHKTVGCFIYDTLVNNPKQKIIGKLVRTVERKFYRNELRQILEFQSKLIPELADRNLYQKCINVLYKSNEAYRNSIANKDFVYLLKDDILFYQRPLKSKKSLISDCPYEFHKDKDGNRRPIKCIAKSNPYFQEFRLWQWLYNLKIYPKDESKNQPQQLSFWDKPRYDEDLEKRFTDLFDFLNDKKEISQDDILKFFISDKKIRDNYRWNYPDDKEKKYPGNETRAEILKCFKNANIPETFLTKEMEYALWHLLYSVDDKRELEAALRTFAGKHNFDADTFAESFKKTKPFVKDYGAYSEKAIKKMLPLMRKGKYWSESAIDPQTRDRIEKIITGEYDETINCRARESVLGAKEITDFQGLNTWQACYVIYNRHSEASEIEKWESPADIDNFLLHFKQHSLHNPVVEQVIMETLRTVRDIWKQEGCIDEIHIELGREMKNPADKRKKMTEKIQENENTNLRIKALLMEFMNDPKIENVRPYSPSQQDILRIYEENALENLDVKDKDFAFVSKISKQAQPSKSDIIKYKCWLEQKYRSPYTGETISLSKLFTDDYQIEHVIPQAKYFDDSLSNKVICEAEVNLLKSSDLAYNFISAHQGEIVTLSGGKTVRIFTKEQYEVFVKDHYVNNRLKMKKLLMDSIPDSFIERQLNDSRYISKYIKALLSNIVREKDASGNLEQEAVSKNMISCNGAITDRLKKDWGVNDVWNKIVLPRFQRLNELTGKDCFTALNTEGHPIPNMPIENQKGFNKKRIDHRHHAMDAIVIACTTRDHVNLLNNEAAHSKHNANRYQLQRKLRRYEKEIVQGKEQEVAKEFLKPWDNFAIDVYNALQNIIVSFKQNLRVINKTVNHYQKFDENGKKKIVKQGKGDSWSIRKSMHKDTVFGEVNLKLKKDVSLQNALKKTNMIVDKELKHKVQELLTSGMNIKQIAKYLESNKDVWSEVRSGKIKVYYFTKDTNDRYFATREKLDASYNETKIREHVTDTGVQKILLAHLNNKNGDPELAFSPDGIDEMNRNIVTLNDGKFHQPIYKVRKYEQSNKKFSIGEIGNKSKKFVEAADGTNLFFVVYENIEKKRFFASVPFSVAVECQKQSTDWIKLLDERLRNKSDDESIRKYQDLDIPSDATFLFLLSVNDLVYIPSNEERQNGISKIDTNRVYKAVSFNKKQCFCIKCNVATPIVNKVEFTSSNKMEKTITGEMIKEICIPLKVDRLGNIVKVGY